VKVVEVKLKHLVFRGDDQSKLKWIVVAKEIGDGDGAWLKALRLK
jgi:hypothetical protein